MSKRFWIIVLAIIAVFVGVVVVTSQKKDDVPGGGSGERVVHITGKTDAKVRLAEYSDFQCSACAAYFPVVEEVVAKYKDQISFEYRHLPLTSVHPNAFAAARASEAAGKQDKFWEMYRLLFENQSVWAEQSNVLPIFEGYAAQLGLDQAQFKKDFASKATNDAINASIAEFKKRGLRMSTPTFLLNDKKITPANSVEEFSKLIDQALEGSR